MLRFLPLLLLALSPLGVSAQLLPGERKGIADALYLRNLKPEDLDFARRSRGEVLPPPVAAMVDQPLIAADGLMRMHQGANRDAADLLSSAISQLAPIRPPDPDAATPSVDPAPVGKPMRLQATLPAPIVRLAVVMARANAEIAQALAKLTPAERRILIDTLPRLAAPEAKFGFSRPTTASLRDAEALLARVDLPRLLAAGEILARDVKAQIPNLKVLDPKSVAPGIYTLDGVTVEIGGMGTDVHSRSNAGLCIDFGGNDRYVGRYGGAAGLASVLIDLGGNDDYDMDDLSLGAGLLGVGLAYDFGGNDRIHTGSLSLGAGVVGVGMFVKEGGDDVYSGGSLSQGYGRSGVGLMLDSGGDDTYRIAGHGQGMGGPQGWGWLVDREGNDVYGASGAYAQGSGDGGIGLLTDLAGDDRYRGDSVCQAAGVRHGLGTLYDASGNDDYLGNRACIGYASENSAAFLFDGAGRDAYAVRGGACIASAQHQSVAVLIDRSGDDLYASGEGRPGLANDASVAIFIDDAGDDRYSGIPAGSVSGIRGDSIGLFLDLGGPDLYGEGFQDGAARVELEGAVALDLPTTDSGPGLPPMAGTRPDPGVESLDRLWDQNDASASENLLAIGTPALVRFLDTRLATANPAEMETALRLVRALGPAARPLVVAHLSATDVAELRHTLVLVGVSGALQASPRVAKMLDVPELSVVAAQAAGLLRAREAVPKLLPLAASGDPDQVLAAMLALERIGDTSALGTAQALLTNPQFPVRQSAMRFLARYGASATIAADRLLGDLDERSQRSGIELLGRLGTPDALNRVGKYLTDSRPGLRLQAMLALQAHCPPSFVATILNLKDDPDPGVRAVAAYLAVQLRQ